MKYKEAFKTNLSEAVELVQRVREVCHNCEKAMTKVIKEEEYGNSQLFVTGLNFTRINYEAIAGIQDSIQSGYLAQSYVLLRWHLELAHLFYVLSDDQVVYQKWLQEEQIRPEEIGNIFVKKEFDTCKEDYLEWSNVTHGNAQYVKCCFNISKQAPINDVQVILAGNALSELMFIGHKINMVSISLLEELIDGDDYEPMVKLYKSVEQNIFIYSEQQNSKERDMLGGNRDTT